MKNGTSSILTLYAISQIHAGSGAAVSTVDLPIQRERHTNYPCIYASSLKGAMRAYFREFMQPNNDCDLTDQDISGQKTKLINCIFGSDTQDGWKDKTKSIPGAVSVSDAKLLAFPIRSGIAPFVWVTCPNIMNRLIRDLKFLGMNADIDINAFNVTENKADILVSGTDTGINNGDKIILEDAVVEIEKRAETNFMETNFMEIHKTISETSCLLLISDEMFDYCISTCTEIQTNIKIDSETGTAQEGALRYQEFLPSDSILYSIVHFKSQLSAKYLLPEAVKNYVQQTVKDYIQVGGDETLGKGICKIDWISSVNESKTEAKK